VRQGEKSTAVVFWKFYGDDNDGEAENVEDETTESSRKRCFARAYHVFNADQVDGFSLPDVPTLPKAQRIQRAEDFFHRTGAQIIETGMRAYDDSNADEIHMPSMPPRSSLPSLKVRS
jgi:antirestriction protein ArdC